MVSTYCWVRSDLSRPQQVVQAAHACAQASKLFGTSEDSNLIVFGVPDAEEMRLIREWLQLSTTDGEFGWYVWREPDIGNQITAICTNEVSDRFPAFQAFELLT